MHQKHNTHPKIIIISSSHKETTTKNQILFSSSSLLFFLLFVSQVIFQKLFNEIFPVFYFSSYSVEGSTATDCCFPIYGDRWGEIELEKYEKIENYFWDFKKFHFLDLNP